MPFCKNPFFVWFTGRTGSTHLCDLLDSHPQIYCRKEDFCEVKVDDPTTIPDGVQQYAIKEVMFTRQLFTPAETIQNPSAETAIGYLGEIYSHDVLAAGFKFKFPNQIAVYPEVAEHLRTVPNIKMIELTRDNPLKQSISLRNVTRLKELGLNRSGNAVASVDLKPMDLDVELAVKHAYYFLRIREEFRSYTESFTNVMRVTYEQLCFQPEETMPRVLDFLGVDSKQGLQSKFTKTTPDNMQEAVANYDELVTAVQGTDLEKYLD